MSKTLQEHCTKLNKT